MSENEDRSAIIECELRLHSGRPADKGTGEPKWDDWSETVVGHAVTFQARANTAAGTWNGPLPPGVDIAAPEALEDPHWTVFLPVARGVPIVSGQVGRSLATGEAFTLAPAEPGNWTANVVFEGAIVTD